MTLMEKGSLVAIFAHPDDEAFGPGGTLALYSKTHDVFVICVTLGQSGKNHHNGDIKNIAKIRCQELLDSAKILGVKKVFFLNYKDGALSNDKYHKIADEIQKITDKLTPEILLTFEERGVSGHIDHIAVSMITHYVFYKAKYAKKLMLFCISEKEAHEFSKDYFIFIPQGYDSQKVDKIIDTSSVHEIRVRAMKEHKSQKKDVVRILKVQEKLPRQELFMIKTK